MLSYLWSFLSGPTSPATPEQAPHLSEQQLHALHVEWTRMQERNRADADALLGKLVEENNRLVETLDGVQRELKDVKAGRKADEEALKAAQKELAKLGGGKNGLAVAILDLEADWFAPSILNSSQPGRAVVEGLIGKLRETLLLLPLEEQRKDWQLLVFVFWSRNADFVRTLLANRTFASSKDFDRFLHSLDSVRPLCNVVINDLPKDQLRQRQRAFATAFARDASCRRLLLGRWAFTDLALAEEVAFTAAAARPAYPGKIMFAEPFVGSCVPPQIHRLEPKILRISNLLRRYPLETRSEKRPLLQLDYTRPLSQQRPPLCLDQYLSPNRCPDERCAFSHDYEIPREVVDALRYEVSRTPCPLRTGGFACDGRACHFAHPPPTRAAPAHDDPLSQAPHTTPLYRQPVQAHSAAGQPEPTPAHLVAVAASAPSSTRSALIKLLSSPQKPPAASPTHAASPTRHEIAPNSPFAHPLSLVDNASNAPDFDAVKLTDAELESMLAKAKLEEAEYAKDLQEDPFWEGRAGEGGQGARLA
ncbi:RHTO0S15e03510g1_1 [Rhodotorula toruloides]|uniref:RHTO0S15e03510g1_1 n=1 Tax=Rhodotorula toruloides TaxID=5286 RepID=A0A061BEV2_RHOTO|nr:RHTO0S15e03510g1_1 [Rhodotorula toruloides]